MQKQKWRPASEGRTAATYIIRIESRIAAAPAENGRQASALPGAALATFEPSAFKRRSPTQVSGTVRHEELLYYLNWKSYIFTLTVWVPAPYSFEAVSPGSVTSAVAPSGMVNVHFHVSPSNFHELFMSPAADLYSAVRWPRRRSGTGRMMMWRKPGLAGSAAMPAAVSHNHSHTEP